MNTLSLAATDLNQTPLAWKSNTAELRPATAAQTDENDLMPYLVLDVIERAAIRDKRSPADVLTIIHTTFPRYTKAQLFGWPILSGGCEWELEMLNHNLTNP